MFLVDRSRDRTDLRLPMLRMAHPSVAHGVEALALYDLETVDERVHHPTTHPDRPGLKREVSIVKEGDEGGDDEFFDACGDT